MDKSGETVKTEGVVERIVFFNNDNGYCIAALKPTGRNAPKENITITGIMPGLQCGETVSVEGLWSRHSMYGPQIKVKTFESRLPSEIYGIEKYLGSGLVEGIGPGYAKKIVDRFGKDTLKIIDTESARLLEVKGIGASRIKKIKASWDEQRGLREISVALRVYGIGMALCVRIIKKFGDDAPRIVREEPYKLAREVDGIGFATADKIALNIGVPNESRERVEAGLLQIVSENEADGSTCIQYGELASRAANMLELDTDRCALGIEGLLASADLKNLGDGFLQGAPLDFAERRIASNLKRIREGESLLPPIKARAAAEWAKKRAGFEFAPEQTSALVSALANKVSVITGGPGTGKTTILRALCDILKAKNVQPVLAAPTGRAAQRMSESAGLEAKTIHRLLGYENGKFVHGEHNPLDAQFVVIDEASMLDTKLAAAVIAAIPSGAHILFVGDIDQLPSVGAGNVLKDIIASGKFAVVRLDKIFRQGERSQIVVAAHDILHGDASMRGFAPTPIGFADPQSDISFIHAESPEECVAACADLVKNKIPKWYGADPISDVQVLAPMHKGEGGISNLNRIMKEELNSGKNGLAYGGGFYSIGDKIMQTRNNYDLDLFNGDMGRVVSINKDADGITADFDGRMIALSKNDLADFQQAYAISIHKSQGSEFPIVVIPLLRQHFVMLQRNLLYTGITRGRKKVFLVGDPSAWCAAVKNSRASRRKTFLKHRLESI